MNEYGVEYELQSIRDRVQEHLCNGYTIGELDGDDRNIFDGFVYGIHCAEISFDSADHDTEQGIIGAIKKEHNDNLKDYVIEYMIISACDLVYSLLDAEKYQ